MEKESHPLRRRIIADSIWNLGATIIARIGGIVFTILAARLLMPEGFGLYNLAISVAFIFMTFADLGINQALIRYVSFELDRNKKKAAAYYYYLLKIKFTLASIISLALLVSSYFLANYVFHKPELLPSLVLLSVYIFILIIEGFYESTFYIKNHVRYITVKEFLFQVIRIICLILAVSLLAASYYVLGAVAGLIITMLVVLVVIFYFSRKVLFFEKPDNYEKYLDKKKLLKFIGFLTIANMSSAFFSYMDVVMLGIFLSSDYIGYYRAAIGFIFAITGTLSFSSIFLSALTRIKREKLQEAFDRIIRYSLVLIIPIIVGLIMLAKYFTVFLYGYDYLPSAFLLYYLSPMILLVMIVTIFLTLLSAKEKTKEFAILTLFILTLNIVLNYVLIKFFINYSQIAATKGVAIATLFSWMIYAVGTIIISRDKLKISFNYRLMMKPLLAAFVMGIFLYFFGAYNLDMSLLKGLFEICIGAIIYFAILLLLGGIKKEDTKVLYDLAVSARIK